MEKEAYYEQKIKSLIEENQNLENKYNELNEKYNSPIKENNDNKNKIAEYEKIIKNKYGKEINLIFMTNDKNVYCSINCQKTNYFKDIINIFFDKYPEYKEYDNIFTINEKKIDKNKTIEENNIQNNDIITIKNTKI